MPQAERYEPTGDLHIFDGEDELPDEEEGSRLALLLVLALVVFAAFGGVVYLAYTQGVKQGRDEAPRPVATSQPSPKVATNTYKNFNVYKPAPSEDELANEDAAPPPPTSIAPAKPATPPTQTKPTTVFPLAHAPTASKPSTVAANTVPSPATTKAKPVVTHAAPAVTKPVPTPPAKQAATAPKQAATTPKQIAPAAAKPAVVTTAPKTSPATTSVATAGPKQIVPQTSAPTPAKPAATKPETTVASVAPPPQATTPALAPPATAPVPAKSAGGYVLQIGAYKSDAEAQASWRAYKSAHAAASGYEPDIIKVDIPGKGTWYRLRVGSFASTADANVLCDKLKASGGSCFPAKR